MVEPIDLSTELHEHIISKLREADGSLLTLKNANLTCKIWHQIATPLLFKWVVFEAPLEPCLEAMHHLDFLSSSEKILSCIRRISIRINDIEFWEDWTIAFEKLLPRLRNLKHVSIGGDSNELVRMRGDFDEDYEITSINWFRNSLFRALKALRMHVTVSLQRYVHTIDHEDLDLSILAPSKLQGPIPAPCLTSIRIAVVYQTNDDYSFSWDVSYPTSPSSEVATLLGLHKNLTHLCLELPGPNANKALHGNHDYEKHHALENIVPTVPHLKSLGLHGEFSISNQAWSHWSSIPWSQLESLSLVDSPVINELAARLVHRPLSSLQTLKLSTCVNEWWSRTPPPDSPSLWESLRGLEVSQLCLTGYAPEMLMDYLHYGTRNARNLRKLRFHRIESGTRLSGSHIEQLGMCPRLAWLGIDIDRDGLPSNVGHNRSLEHLDALAKLRPLQHIRIFIHDNGNDSERLYEREILGTFKYVQFRKQGCPLDSMVICWDHGGWRGLWIVWGWGEGQAVIDCRVPRTPRQVEIWDTESLSKLGECATRWKDWETAFRDRTGDLLWGISDGW